MREQTGESIDYEVGGADSDPPTLVRVGRRRESHRLALVSAVGIIFLATAIAKPWGVQTPAASNSPSDPTSSVPSIATYVPDPESAPAATPAYVPDLAVDPGHVPFVVMCGDNGAPVVAIPESSALDPAAVRLTCDNADLQQVQVYFYWTISDSFAPSSPEPGAQEPSPQEPSEP